MLLALRPPLLLMTTGVNAVSGTGPAGWISGDPAGLVASGTVACLFDLGPDWRQYRSAGISVSAAAGGGGLQVGIYWNDAAALNYQRTGAPPGYGASAGIQIAITAGANGGPIAHNSGVMGRYLTLAVTNTSGVSAVAAGSAITVAAYPS